MDLKRALRGFSMPPRKGATLFALRQIKAIAEIEEMLADPSVEWRASFEEARDRASLATFGITEKDTRPKEPHPDDVQDNDALARWYFSDEAFENYSRQMDAWFDWQAVIGEYELDLEELGPVAYWRRRQIDVADEYGAPLKCFRLYSRQLYAAVKGLLPGAKVTIDGSGKRAAQSAEEWGAALAAEAARFKASR